MALLDTCLCCSLMVASFVIGVYALVAYVIAFSVEFWWIIETSGSLPTAAHLLCADYFVSLVLCAVLLHGLTVKRSTCLLVWLIGVASLALPEAGLVLYMSLQHWKVQTLYGLTEITCWACRLLINIAGVVSVHSLQTSWTEERDVMRRLRDLNMSSATSNGGRRGSVISSNGVLPGLGLAYQNDGFVGSVSQINGKTPVLGPSAPGRPATYAVPLNGPKLKRSTSSASRRSSCSVVSMPALPMGPMPFMAPMPAMSAMESPLYATYTRPAPSGHVSLHRSDSTSEFNAAAFDGILAASLRGAPGRDVVDSPANAPNSSRFTRLSKAQSLVELRRSGSRVSDYWRVETSPSRPVSVAYMVPTQSLDRRLLKAPRPRRAVSMADLAAPLGQMQPMYYRDAYGRDYIYSAPYFHPVLSSGMLYRGASSKTSLGAASDDFRKYRDVAL